MNRRVIPGHESTARTTGRNAKPVPSKFKHVSDRMLRRVLEAKPEDLALENLVIYGITPSIRALGYDAIRDDIPAHAFEARREAAREAVEAIRSNHKTLAHAALQKFWLN
jgi:hypothetical protein